MAVKPPAAQAILRPPPTRYAGPPASGAGNPTTPAAFDRVDHALVRALLADSKISNRDLAQQLEISESAVSVRLRKLMGSGALVFTAVIDWERAGYEWWVIALIKTRKRPAADVAGDVGTVPQCASAAVVIGSQDLIAYLAVKDRAELRQVTDTLRSIDGVGELDVELTTDTRVSALGRQLFLAIDPAPILLPAPCIELDSLDLSILQALIDDGRRSGRSIARELEVSEGTVRARINRMTQSGLVQVVAMVDPVAFGLASLLAAVMIRADRSRIDAMVKEFMAMPNVAFVGVCLGNWDLHVGLLAADHTELVEFIGSTVRGIDGVIATETLLFANIVRFNPCLRRVTALSSVA